MRSVFFQNPLEYQIQTENEGWNQGDSIQGRLRVRNISAGQVSPIASKVVLAYAVRKELKSGDAHVWKVLLEKTPISEESLLTQGEITAEWEIELPDDCPITDKAACPFLLFGGEKVMEEGGRIDLRVELHPLLQSFLQTFTTQFKFLEKYRKSREDYTEVKLIPPESKEFPNLEQILCLLRIHDEQLESIFRFRVKGFSRDGESMKVVKKKREFEIQMNPDEYLLPGGFPNRNLFREKISEALDVARQRVF